MLLCLCNVNLYTCSGVFNSFTLLTCGGLLFISRYYTTHRKHCEFRRSEINFLEYPDKQKNTKIQIIIHSHINIFICALTAVVE